MPQTPQDSTQAELYEQEKRIGDSVHTALCMNGVNNALANFFVDLLLRIRKLERESNAQSI